MRHGDEPPRINWAINFQRFPQMVHDLRREIVPNFLAPAALEIDYLRPPRDRAVAERIESEIKLPHDRALFPRFDLVQEKRLAEARIRIAVAEIDNFLERQVRDWHASLIAQIQKAVRNLSGVVHPTLVEQNKNKCTSHLRGNTKPCAGH